METLQIIARAKRYLENLAQGVDPISRQPAPGDELLNRAELFTAASQLLQKEIDWVEGRSAAPLDPEKGAEVAARLDELGRGLGPSGSGIPDGSILKQERLQKCFCYTVQVLQKRLDRDKASAMRARLVYALSPEEVRRRIVCSREPVTLWTFLGPAGCLLGFTGKKGILPNIAMAWLVQAGYADRREGSGKIRTLLTPQGEAAGLSQETSKDGIQTTVCSEQGQRFLLDNLEQILTFERNRWESVRVCLTPEFLGSIPCEAGATSPTSFLKCVNAHLPPELPRKFQTDAVNAWLVKEGLLEDIFINGDQRERLPTEIGEAVGLAPLSSGGIAKKGTHWIPAGQRFVLAHLRDIARDLGSGAAYQTVPVEFPMTEELLGRFSYSRNHLTHNGVTEWLNAVLWPELGIRLPSGLVPKWLAAEGFLTRTARPGESKNVSKTILVPTKKGTAIGLTLEHGWDYVFTGYQGTAQRYVAEHLTQIMEFWRDWCGTP